MLLFLLILLPFTVNVIYIKKYIGFFVRVFLSKKYVSIKLQQNHTATLPF